MDNNIYRSSYTGEQIDEAVRRILEGGICSGEHVIDVSELPIENIDENAVYKCGDTYYRYGESDKTITHICVVDDGVIIETYTPQQLLPGERIMVYYEVSRPNNPFESSISGIIHAYYIETEDDIFVYGNIDGDETTPPEWTPLFWSGTTEDGEKISLFRGAVTSIDEVGENPEDGVYALIEVNKGWKSYGHPCIIDVSELPTENIDKNAIYRVIEEKCYDIGAYSNDGVYVSILLLGSAILGVPIRIFNVDSLDSVENPQPYPTAFYYCRADHKLYSYDDEEGVWDASDGRDDDSLFGTPGWKVSMDHVYYTRADIEEGIIDMVMAEDGMRMPYSALYGDMVQYHTVSRIPYSEDEDYEEAMADIQPSEDEGPWHFYYSAENKDMGSYQYFEETDADTEEVTNSGYQWYYIHTIPRIPNPEDADYETAMADIRVTEGELADGPVHLYFGEEDKQTATYGYVEETDPDTGEVTSSGYQWVYEDTGFRGFIYDEAEAFVDGMYALLSTGWEKHVRPRGMICVSETGAVIDVKEAAHVFILPPRSTKTITSNGTYDVANYGEVKVSVTNIPSGYIKPSGTKTITENGTGIDISQYATVDVNVPITEGTTETKTVTPTKSTQTVVPTNADYLSQVTVNPIPDEYIIPTGTVTITENGNDIDVRSYEKVTINVGTDITTYYGDYINLTEES